MVMKKRQYAIAGLAAVLLATATACTADLHPGGEQSGQGVAVTLSVDMAAAGGTRAAEADVYTRFAEGDQLWLHMPQASGPTGRAYAAAAAGSSGVALRPVTTPLVTDGLAQYPIYAYAPYIPGTAAVSETTAAFSVAQNQTGAAAYKQSDMLYGEGTVAAAGTAALAVSHKMAQLVLKPYCTTGEAGEMQSLCVIAGHRTVTLAGTAPLQFGQPADALSAASPLTVFTGPAELAATADGATPYYCLLPPQMLQAGAVVRLVTTTGVRVSYRLTAATRLESGQSYTMALPVTAISTDVDIAPWQNTDWQYAADGTQDYRETRHTISFTVHPQSAGGFATAAFTMIHLPYNPSAPQDCYLGQTEVTNGLWYAVMGSKPPLSSHSDSDALTDVYTEPATRPAGGGQRRDGDEYPVSYIKYAEMLDFISRLNALTATQRPAGYEFALPTVDQWKWAAYDGAATSSEPYSSNEYAWTATTNSQYKANSWGTTHPVATLKPTKLGFYDMAGNVQELTSTPGASGNHLECGGGYLNEPGNTDVRKSSDGYDIPDGQYKNDMGLRLALVARTGHALSEAAVGDIIASNGLAYAPTDVMPAGVVGRAMVVMRSVPHDASAPDRFDGKMQGIAMALTDYPNTSVTYADAEAAVRAMPAVAGCSQWSLPGTFHWMRIVYDMAKHLGIASQTVDGYKEYYVVSAFWTSTMFAERGGQSLSGIYWSATPNDDTVQKGFGSGCFVGIYADGNWAWDIYTLWKTDLYRSRPILAF